MSNNGNMDSLRAKPNAVALHEWQCKKCTYANAISRIKCVMCMEGKRPPGVGRTQPLSPRPPGEENREWFEEQDSSVTKKKVSYCALGGFYWSWRGGGGGRGGEGDKSNNSLV